MARHHAVIPAVALLAVALAAPLLAQGNTTGSLRGTVSDAEGGVLPGVTVTALSDALIGGQTMTVTDERGNYRFPSLPVGIYAVDAELSGFKKFRQENLRVSLAKELTLNVTMALAAVAEEITVTADAPVVSVVNNAVDASFDQSFLDTQPLPRFFSSLMNYAPGVNDGLAFGGTDEAENAYMLDGVNVSDPAGGTEWIFPSVDWVQEVQVAGLGANAEYGGFTAGILNAVTKSGGNEFAGDLVAYYAPEDFVSDNSEGEEDETFAYQELSLSLGGALAKDKLWYFASASWIEDERTPYGALDSDVREYLRGMAKLTLQGNTRNRVMFLVDYDGVDREHRGVSALTLPSASYQQDSPNISYNLTWEGLINDSNFVTVKLTGFDGSDDRSPYNGDQPNRYDVESGYSWQNAVYTIEQDRQRQSLDAAWNLFADGLIGADDTHAFKFGVTYETGSAKEDYWRNGGFSYYDDSYYCDSTDDYFANPDCGIYSADFGDEIHMDAEQAGLALFAQDSWKVGRFNLNLGVRYGAYQGGFAGGASDVYDVDFVDPRVGFVVDLFGNGRTALKAHYGRYHAGMFSYMYDREESGEVFTPFYYCDYDFDDGDFTDCSEPTLAAARMDGGINHPYVDQFVASFEQQLGRDMSVGVDYVIRETRDIVAMVNVNDDYDVLTAPGNPLGGGSLPFYDLLSEPEYVLTNPSAAYKDYDAIMLRFDKRYSHGWLLKASFVYADLTGNVLSADGYVDEFEDLNGQTNADGKLRGFSKYEGKINLTVDLPLGLQLSGYYRYLSGEYWTPYVRVRGLYFNDPQNVNMVARGAEQLPDRNMVDLRLTWTAPLGGDLKLALFLDAFNVFNEGTITDVNERWGDYRYDYEDHPDGSTWRPSSTFGETLSIERPRELRIGARFSF
ncbi:MAG: carboxypeptidase regulatory-like domain-containing protein [Acidobacteriota bacterium]